MYKQTVNDKQSHLKGCLSERSMKVDDVAEDDPTEGLVSGIAADQPWAICPLLFLSLSICSISLISLDFPHWQLWNSRFQPTMRHVLFRARIRVRNLRGCQKLIILRSITFYCKIWCNQYQYRKIHGGQNINILNRTGSLLLIFLSASASIWCSIALCTVVFI